MFEDSGGSSHCCPVAKVYRPIKEENNLPIKLQGLNFIARNNVGYKNLEPKQKHNIKKKKSVEKSD